ncbi:NADP-dependent oxidoreductase domain-containing protein [Vararia minispora EC-137]|uniref:NADP-dependent oxidoreductase domain-containing protein n=1 Tax=Vararia minispora EC-137 TaxID=1314806 RepID=A0ACB8QQC9_9AGAM|nr:NADP-dependent oxidoreductase domain-containing protein [Vararia minispora EC-137]
MSDYFPYQQKNMPFRRLGKSGLRVPVFSLGGWLTFGGTVKGDPVKEIVKVALENGINMFDEAENYSAGQSELEMGRVLKELNVRRSDIVLTTKLFWGVRPGPNNGGLSRKHIIEGLRESLQRLQTDYVDVVFAHRGDPNVSMLEIVKAFSWVIDQGLAFYWGTSEWSACKIEEANQIAIRYGLHAPIAEQCQYHLFHRERPEGEYVPLYEKYRLGTTVWSALASGLLTGKVAQFGSYSEYNDGIPAGSRLDTNSDFFKNAIKRLQSEEGQHQIAQVRELTKLAESELGCTVSQLSLAWVARNPNTSTVILGASRPEQVLDNLKAIEVYPRLTPEILRKIEKIVDNKPMLLKDMIFRRLGSSGLRVPLFSLGGWLTFGKTVTGDPVKEIVKTALENGINMFDEAESYAGGKSEEELGRVLKELGVRRADLILTTKIFWGTRKGPNSAGLSRKHIIEGVKESLQRMQIDYFDVVFAHRFKLRTVPTLEIVKAFSWVIDQGLAYYWGTSEWNANEIEEACLLAERYGLHAPIAEQCAHNLFKRERPEKEYDPLYKKYNIGTTVFSALAAGMLTGKYNEGVIPSGSRFDTNRDFYKGKDEFLLSEEGQLQIKQVKALTEIAEKDLGCSMSQLALAWVARNPNTSTVILGATKPEQVIENLKALEVCQKLTPEILEKIEGIVQNKPTPPPSYGRPALDPMGRS